MDLKVIKLKPLRNIYLNFLVICLLITIGSFILYKTGFQFFRGSNWVVEMKNLLLWGMVGLAVVFTMYQVNQKKKLQALLTVDEKISFFEVYYRRRLWWHVLSCVVSGFLLLLTARMIFIYFCLFDVLSMLLAYPSEFIIKKEMKEDDLMFVK
ncbi:MAG TPA: hypothetical protein VK483_04400 [Chitinophagaceae bacterium]|nr:hypothetical protein [Chitinophagaceae bacterium]